jgi:hypothetical protein
MIDLLPDAFDTTLVRAGAEIFDGLAPGARRPGSRELWRRAARAGWFDPDQPLRRHVVLARALGEALAPLPLTTTLLAAWVAAAAEKPTLLEAIVAGRTVVAHAERHLTLAPPAAAGELAAVVLDGRDADAVLVGAGPELTLVASSALRDLETHPALDPGVSVATARLDTTAPLASVSDPRLSDVRLVLLAAYAVGLCAAATAASTDHARRREQFNRPIGAFQAISHRCADMAIRTEAADSLTALAGLLVGDSTPDSSFHAASAALLASRSALANAADNIQNHGARGTLWDEPAHRLLKRAHLLDGVLGPDRALLRRVLDATSFTDL